MAYVRGTWISPIDIVGTMKINQTDEALQNIVSDDADSIANFINEEMTKVEDEIGTFESRVSSLESKVTDLETFQGTVENIVEW